MSATDILGKIGEKVGTEIKSVKDDLTTHTSDQTNPHSVNKSQVGLGNVENTALSTFAGSSNITKLGTIASGSIPYSLVTNAPNPNAVTGDLSISGNLQVNGTQTILNTQKLEVEDNIIELNLKTDGSETAQTAGIEINRGTTASSPQTYDIEVSDYDNIGDYAGQYEFTNGTNAVPSVVDGAKQGLSSGVIRVGDTLNITNNSGVNFTIWDSNEVSVTTIADGGSSQVVFTQENWYYGYQVQPVNNQNAAGNSSVGLISVLAQSNSDTDKAKIIWDDTTSKFRLRVGNAATDLVVDKIYNNNMFATIGDLPSATQYHGMMAHVHATGQSYFAHGGNWVELISVSGGQTIGGNIAASSFLAPDKDGVKINNVSLGDYATFETALTTAMA